MASEIQTRRSISVPGIVYEQTVRLATLRRRSISEITAELLRAECAKEGIEPLTIEECEAKRRTGAPGVKPWLDERKMQRVADEVQSIDDQSALDVIGSEAPVSTPTGSTYRAMNDASRVAHEILTGTPVTPVVVADPCNTQAQAIAQEEGADHLACVGRCDAQSGSCACCDGRRSA